MNHLFPPLLGGTVSGMTRSKLTNTEKTQILALSQQPGATVASLAEQFGVSTTTIRRILKTAPPPSAPPAVENAAPEQAEAPAAKSKPSPRLRSRQGSRLDSLPTPQATAHPSDLAPSEVQGELLVVPESLDLFEPEPEAAASALLEDDLDELDADLEADLDEDLELDATLEDEDDLDDLDEDLENDELDEDLENDEDIGVYIGNRVRPETLIQVLPLSAAAIPRTCYLVVDRAAELITRPLREFAELGQIPSEEIQEKTLPVFDNHRVARRFSNRMQRVIKLPDGALLQKTGAQLHAKGITRLLINGQVYSLQS